MVPATVCTKMGINGSDTNCLSDFLNTYLNTTRFPSCSQRGSQATATKLVSMLDVQVQCVEAPIVPLPSTKELDRELYCGYFQVC